MFGALSLKHLTQNDDGMSPGWLDHVTVLSDALRPCNVSMLIVHSKRLKHYYLSATQSRSANTVQSVWREILRKECYKFIIWKRKPDNLVFYLSILPSGRALFHLKDSSISYLTSCTLAISIPSMIQSLNHTWHYIAQSAITLPLTLHQQ